MITYVLFCFYADGSAMMSIDKDYNEVQDLLQDALTSEETRGLHPECTIEEREE